MSKVARFFRKKILLKYDNNSIEELFFSSFVEQINDFQVHLGSLIIFVYSILNIVINIVSSNKQNRITEIILFSILITISLIVLVVGRIVVSSRFILLYIQQIYFIALHTILIISASERSDKLYLIIVCYSLHIVIMPQSQHIYVIISNVIFITLILISYNQFDWQELWQLWILLSIIGLELRFFVDEKQKRLLFHDEKQIIQKDNNIDELPIQIDQGSPTSSTRANNNNQNNIKNNDINSQIAGKQQRYFQSNRPTIGHQQTQQNSGNNIFGNQGSNNQENVETQRQIPQTQQSPQSQQHKTLQKQNSKNGLSSQSVYNQQFSTSKQNSLQNNNLVSGHNHFNNQNGKQKIDSPLLNTDQHNSVSNLKRKMTIFHIRKGMDELKKFMQSSSLHINEIGQAIQNGEINNGISNSLHRSDLPHAIQLSPLISNPFESIYNIQSATKRTKQNNIYNFLPCSFIYCKLDPQNMEQIQLIYANNKAKSDYQIVDNTKLDDFLKKSKVSSSLLKFQDASINSLKKIILLNYQQILDESKFMRSQIISHTHLLTSDYKRNQQEYGQNFFNSTKKNNTVIQKRLSLLPNKFALHSELKEKENKGIQVLIDFHGKKYVIKIVILPSDELYIFINDDGFEKFILEKKRRATCDQLINIIDMMINRFQTIQQMLCSEIPASKKEILMEIFLATNYAQNIQNSIKEQLQQNIEVINRKIILSVTLNRVKEMIERKYKNVHVLIDEEIPNECKKIYNDPYHLVRTLTNIIENSYSNTQTGFVQILLHQSRIFKDHLRFDIIDSGKGIDPQILQLINESNFFNDEEEEDAINRLFLLFSSLSTNSDKVEEKEQEKSIFQDYIIKGFGLKFSHHMIKIIGPYNRMFAESIPGIGSRISFIVYKEGPPSQDTVFKPYQFKNNNFEQEMEYFNPLNKSASNNKNCSLEEYIQHMNIELNKIEPPSLNNSFVNINVPNQFKTFKTPFSQNTSKSNNTITSNREIRSTSAHQIKQNKNKVSFSKIRSQKNIIENQRNFLIQKQLSPLIQGMSVANVVNYKIQQQNSLRLSSSPPGYNQNILNIPQSQDIYIDNFSNCFRNIDPASSQMYSDYQNNGQYQIQVMNQLNPKLNKRSSKENNQNVSPSIYLNLKKNNQFPSSINNSIFFQDQNVSSGQNGLNATNLHNIPQSHASLSNITHIGQNTTFYTPKADKLEHLINQNAYNQNYSNPPSSQFIGNDSYQQQEDGYFIKKIQH
ncbi:ATPase, histidine kinase-, DNA gyrase B (macronuclear) [Tetrahymena thermophila SB210]|uniref:ATPase, histidine kinase-, DNA gyrase B n=1 Tax=Tetrahymena thermophila (strain SB210) TaxID=312017 RepID=Q248D3_TETTS|nr:ATPase, histidine kinase-, DNA gyrase B [Tetrahymena thermophila SB210]EAS04112.2 ATPase, histidine kinase-, DNA gyrase B [Tetrahymena thermophila SB210]|eukprot:XP_001024357.2 ATPase, histidine kinase-, DNA gyrase B [Tetrahymena thermophila SB210]